MDEPYLSICDWCGGRIWMKKVNKWAAYEPRLDGSISKVPHALYCKKTLLDKSEVEFME